MASVKMFFLCVLFLVPQPTTQQTADVCTLPKDTGPCRAAFPRYYFNAETKKCEIFTYGGCDGNDNNFQSLYHCNSKCAESLAECNLKKDTGNPGCNEKLKRYFFDKKSQKCKKFIYSGCGGNDNRFKSKKVCKNKCVIKTEICGLPQVVGPCKASFTRFAFNPETATCDEFIYGGCRGNRNNFETKGMCERKCIRLNGRSRQRRSLVDSVTEADCKLPSETGFCRASFPRFYFDYQTGSCEKFTYGGCGGNKNNFKTIQDCESQCGQYKSNKNDNNALFFDILRDLMNKFRLSGGGTVNQQNSNQPPQKKEAVCDLPKKTGNCFGYFKHFYYNSNRNQCEEFVYGGCNGNGNRFSTKEWCQSVCVKNQKFDAKRDCQLPPKQGPCEAAITSYFYNKTSGICEQFLYGGCQGNNNRFETIDVCNMNCGNIKSDGFDANTVCKLQPETGVCLAYFRKYYYDATSGSCKQFVYGGCLGNDNRFDTEVECKAKCAGVAAN